MTAGPGRADMSADDHKSSSWTGGILYLLLVLSPVAASAAVAPVRIEIEHIVHPQFEAEQLSLTFAPATADMPAALQLSAASLRIEILGRRLRDVSFECTPEQAQRSTEEAGAGVVVAEGEKRLWQCEGPLRWRGGSRGWRLRWHADERLTVAHVVLAEDRSEIGIELPLAGAPLAIEARRLAASWLQPLLPQLTWQQGRIDGRVEKDAQARWRGQLRVRSLSAEAVKAPVAFAGVDLTLPVDVRKPAAGSFEIRTSARLAAGELLAGTAYVGWPAGSEVSIELAATAARGTWQIDRLALHEPGIDATAQATLQPGDEAWLKALDLQLDIDLSKHYERYFEAFVAGLGHAGLQASGELQAQLALGAGGKLQRLQALLDDVSLRQPEGRFAIEGVEGTLGFSQTEDAPEPFQLRWRDLSLHALHFGDGMIEAQTGRGEIRARPVTLDLSGGRLVIGDLVVRSLSRDADLLKASLAVQDVDIAGLARVFGWPPFAGRLDGRFPSLRYAGEQLVFDGGIAMRMFGGEVHVEGLQIERPFGIAPALAGSARIDGLDLVPMTEVFGLGRIEGRLNGRIDGLRLLDWRPTAFDARLETDDEGRRRISQLAVAQLTSIGGGGAAGLQGRLLGVFDSFGYRKIALSCRLANDVCEMGGIDEAAGGYTILQGSGLPLITIRGFARRVDWPVLVERLRSVASGQRPVVD